MQKIGIHYHTVTGDLANKAKILGLAGEETRIRILCLMFERQGTCVTDIGETLGVPMAAVSHHLRLLEDNGIISSERKGKRICYSLVQSPLLRHLRQFICHKE